MLFFNSFKSMLLSNQKNTLPKFDRVFIDVSPFDNKGL